MQAVQQHGGGRDVQQEPMRRRINNFLSRMVSRFRIVLLVIVIAAVVFLAGYFIYSQVQSGRASRSAMAVEAAQTTYASWQSETDATKKAPLEKKLLDELAVAINDYPNQYGAQRGLFIRADVNFANKAWDAAIKDYQALVTRFPKSYLAPISLFNEAICYEEKGDVDTAQSLYVLAYTN
jgi:hypothetical protein